MRGGELDTAIFFMDMRTYGKEFELYYNRAREHGVRFIRSRVHTIDPDGECNLRIDYADEDGTSMSEVFDMVVLSVGFEVGRGTVELAERLWDRSELASVRKNERVFPRRRLPPRDLRLRGRPGTQGHSAIGHGGVGKRLPGRVPC